MKSIGNVALRNSGRLHSSSMSVASTAIPDASKSGRSSSVDVRSSMHSPLNNSQRSCSGRLSDHSSTSVMQQSIFDMDRKKSMNQRDYEEWKTTKWGEDELDLVQLDADDLDLDIFYDFEIPSRSQILSRLKMVIQDSLVTTGLGCKILRQSFASSARALIRQRLTAASSRNSQGCSQKIMPPIMEETSPVTPAASETPEPLLSVVSRWFPSVRTPLLLSIWRTIGCSRRNRNCPRRPR